MNDLSDPNSENYDELKKFFEAFSARYFPKDQLPVEQQPLELLATLEKRGRKGALKQLQQMITDCMEMSRALPIEEVRRFDSELAARGVPSLSELRRRYSRYYRDILKRGRIRTEEEYRLVRMIADNLQNNVPPDELGVINALLLAYEKQATSSPR